MKGPYSIVGAFSSLTLKGLPDMMTALTSSPRVGILLKGYISQKMFNSLTLLAIS